jgi:hypothetical protein
MASVATFCFRRVAVFAGLLGDEYFGAHVAVACSPVVVLLGQHRADEPDDGVAARGRSRPRRSACGFPCSTGPLSGPRGNGKPMAAMVSARAVGGGW